MSDVRVIGPGELTALRAMLDLFGRAFDDTDTYTARQPDDAYLQRLLSSDTCIVIGAFAGATFLSGLSTEDLPSTTRDASSKPVSVRAIPVSRSTKVSRPSG